MSRYNCGRQYANFTFPRLDMTTEHWWNDSDKAKPKYWKKILYQCLFVDNTHTHTLSKHQIPDLMHEKPATSRSRYSRAPTFYLIREINVLCLQIENTLKKNSVMLHI